MKNLILLGEKRHALTSSSSIFQPNDIIVDIAYDLNNTFQTKELSDHPPPENPYGEIETQLTFLLLSRGLVLAISYVGDDTRDEDRTHRDDNILWKSDLSPLASSNSRTWFDATYSDEIEKLVCLSRDGTIATLDPQTKQTESVGCFDHGIRAGRWSPDLEVLALYTYTETEHGLRGALLTMNCEFEILTEVILDDAMTKTTNNEISLGWRQDGSKLVVSSLDFENRRKLYVYDRDTLKLDAISRTQDGSGKPVLHLTESLAWGGDAVSNVIASVQQRSCKSVSKVVFFEPNGLRHREFDLRPVGDNETKVLSLDWNVGSDLLAVTICQFEKGKEDEATHSVQIWHRSNFHWYMKYELRYSNHFSVTMTRFDSERPNRLRVSLKNEMQLEWRIYDFCWDVLTDSHGTALITDGELLNFTPLEKAIVPPPMYAATLPMKFPVVGVTSFAPSKETQTDAVQYSHVVHLSDGSLVLLGRSPNDTNEKSAIIANYSPPDVITHVPLSLSSSNIDTSTIRQLTTISQKHFSESTTLELVALSCGLSPNEHLVEIEITLSPDGKPQFCNMNEIVLEGRALRIQRYSNAPSEAIVELTNGMLLHYSPTSGSLVPMNEPLLEPCPYIAAISSSSPNPPLVIGLSHRSRLYCNDHLLSNAASCFTLSTSHHFLSYISLGSIPQLRFVPLSILRSIDPLENDDNLQQTLGYEPRNVERGSKLVCIMPSKPALVLQLPRGNLEALYPRALVLPHAFGLIRDMEYSAAFDILKRQKIDSNLIVDWNPRLFLDRISLFLRQVNKVDDLNLFISFLADGDVTATKYTIPTWVDRESKDDDFDFVQKRNVICQILREEMLRSKNEFVLPILTTYAKEEPPRLEAALFFLQTSDLANDDIQTSIQYLASLSNYELLFDTALGTYDYELAQIIARNSQRMDPKIYLPLLKRYKTMPEYLAKYEVDLRLKRYDSALRNSVRAECENEKGGGDAEEYFEKCMALMEEHDLHRLGLTLFCLPDRKRRVLISLGNKLVKERKGKEALAIFLSARPQDREGAKQAARMCGDWQTFFACLADDEETKRIAAEVAEEIASGKGSSATRSENLKSAARILLDYCHDVEGAIDKLIQAEWWSEARRIAKLHSHPNSERKCSDAAVSFARTCLEELDDRATKFEEANERYGVVLMIQKKAKRDAAEGEGADAVDDTGSLFSVASNVSDSSLYSHASSTSTGSTVSVSSVISIGTKSNFSITSEHDVNKHKSKFNKVGRRGKKKKTLKKKMKPGSEDELKSLVSSLQSNCIDEEYRRIVSETIQFLIQTQSVELARELYDGYCDMKVRIDESQRRRKEMCEKEEKEQEQNARREGQEHESVVLKCEGVVDGLKWEELPEFLREVLQYLT